MIRPYYEEELRYLHEAGKAYAESHKEAESVRYLNIDSVADRDPYVERLFEGFAFLTGRVHQRLDEDLPEYTEGLLTLLCPHLLKSIPALCMVELRPKPGLLQETRVMEPGLEVRSAPVGDERAVCRFTTTQPVRLQPIRLTQAELDWKQAGASGVRLTFELDRGVKLSQLEGLSPLRLHFHADPSTASMMHLFFTRHVAEMTVSAAGASGGRVVLRGQDWIRPGGFGPDEGLLPYGPQSFSGQRVLQEYLCYRQKFWCVDLYGLEQLDSSSSDSSFSVVVTFDRPYPEKNRFKTENVRLHCTPAVNLFSTEAEPIRVDHLVHELRVVPSARYRRSLEAYDVLEVAAIEEGTGRRHSYRPFYRFDQRGRQAGRHYVERRRTGPEDRPEIYLSLGGIPPGALTDGRPETLSLQIRCTNGTLPREGLQEGMVNGLAPEVPQIVQPTNITRPTLIRRPPTDRHDDFFWMLISHWSLNYLSIAGRDTLMRLLDLYDWSETDANSRRIAGIRDVRWAGKEMLRRGAVLRGAEVTIEIQEDHFSDEGDVNLFGLVLSEFLRAYATINSFVHLVIELVPSGKRYEWKPTSGALPTL